ncbi:hypothetical protein V6N13_096300 [Hibiscus sabdariffa]|uniref:Uncharacterized protein n=1 Tax=Hibiscus sabdariffa TaxID=183260 RepID=A0ABR2DG57_9ROSI
MDDSTTCCCLSFSDSQSGRKPSPSPARLLDSKFSWFLPFVMVIVVMLQVMNGVQSNLNREFQNQLLGNLGIDKDKVDESCKLIMELSRTRVEGNSSNKRMFSSILKSLNGVMNLFFNFDRSNDSWTVSSSTLFSSPEPVYKKFKTQQVQFLERLDHAPPYFLSIPH